MATNPQAQKGTHLLRRPSDYVVIGVDTKDDESHHLYDQRAPDFLSLLAFPRYSEIVSAYYTADTPPSFPSLADLLGVPLDTVASIIDQEAFIRSIQKDGVRTPIDVTKDGDEYIVVAGRLRVLGAREAERRVRSEIFIPSMMCAGNELRSLDAMVSENEHRSADTPLNRGRKAMKLISWGRTMQEVAITFKRDVQTIQQWIALASAPQAIQDMVETGVLPATSGIRIATSSLSNKDKVATAQGMVESGETTSRAVTAHVRRAKQAKANKAAGKKTAKGVPVTDAAVVMRPNSRKLRWIVNWAKENESLDPEIIKTLQWVLGDIPMSRVPGMAKAVRAYDARNGEDEEATRGRRPADDVADVAS